MPPRTDHIDERRNLDWAMREVGVVIDKNQLTHLHADYVRLSLTDVVEGAVLRLSAGMLAEKLLRDVTDLPYEIHLDVPYVHVAEVPIPNPWYRRMLGLPERTVTHYGAGKRRVRVSGRVPVEVRHVAAYPEHKLDLSPEQFGKPVRISRLQVLPDSGRPYVEDVVDGGVDSGLVVGQVEFPE